MTKFMMTLSLMAIAGAAFAAPVPSTQVPTAEMLPMLGVGLVAALVARRLRK